MREELGDGKLLDVRDLLCNERQKAWRVGRAAVGHGGQVGRIGLEKDALHGGAQHCLAHVLRGLEGHHAVVAEHEPGLDGELRQVEAGAEAVDDAAPVKTSQMLPQDGLHVVVGLAAVDDHGQVQFGGELQLPRKHLPLHLAIRMVVEVVEADFSDRYHLRVLCTVTHLLGNSVAEAFRLVGVDSLGAENVRCAGGDAPHRVQVFRADGYGDNAFDTDGAGGIEFSGQIGVVEIIQVAVGFCHGESQIGDFPALFFHRMLTEGYPE